MDREAELLALKKQSVALGTDIQIDPNIDKLLLYKTIIERMIVLFNDRIKFDTKLTKKLVAITNETIKWKQVALDQVNIRIMLATNKLNNNSGIIN